MNLIEKGDLMFGRRGLLANTLASILMQIAGINAVNRLYRRVMASPHPGSATLLREIGAGYHVQDKDLDNIPTTGPLIIVANHATGALDGIVLIDMISRIRPEVKFMGNFLLEKVDFLKQYFIPVDPFDNPDAGRNMRGLRASLAHVRGGGALVIFPAGEVATWQKGFSQLRDKRWSDPAVRFIRSAGAPVTPICIEASNSLWFHLAGKIHPRLRTALLVRELLNKRKKMAVVNVGAPLTPRRLEGLEDIRTYGDYLRANVEYLTHKRPRRKLCIVPKRKRCGAVPEEVSLVSRREMLREELAAIRPGNLLFGYGSYEVFFVQSALIPNMMHEIGRMREITFRGVGEGSMKSIDTDRYDEYYRQLFIWDAKEEALVGAYRMGLGGDIIPRYGLDGFYTNSLFRFSPEMASVMEQTIELGRSFITGAYQRKPASLMLLWKGILYVLLRNDSYRNLLGPVTISGEFQSASKILIVTYLKQRHLDAELAAWVRPVTGLEGIDARIDAELIKNVEDIELINKIVSDIERGEFSIPVLIRKYLQLNSHVLGFNVDHDFCDALDALMLLDLKKIPESVIAMLSKEITDIDVVERFKRLR